jgi:hypothetical protein
MTIVGRRPRPTKRNGRRVVLATWLALLSVACTHTTPTALTATTGSAAGTTSHSAPPAEPTTVTGPPTTTTSGATTAAAGPGEFQSPSGGIFCSLSAHPDGKGGVECQGGGNYPAPAPPNCHLAWGDRFSLDQGTAAESRCHGDTIVPSHSNAGPIPAVPVLRYGQTRAVGTITCASAESGVTCTDASTGHYIHLSREANGLG